MLRVAPVSHSAFVSCIIGCGEGGSSGKNATLIPSGVIILLARPGTSAVNAREYGRGLGIYSAPAKLTEGATSTV